LLRPNVTASIWQQKLRRVSTYLLPLYCVQRARFSNSILLYSTGMCRMRRFLPVLRNFFHSSLLHNFMPPFSINYSSILLTLSCHLFLGLLLKLLVPKFIYNTYKILMPGEMPIVQLCYVDGNLSVCKYLYNMTWQQTVHVPLSPNYA
jgi:hypothetical protein